MDNFGTLYIVATPIGNLEDITLRAIRILKEVDFILCEDTRVTKRLLEKYGIQTPTKSYHQHSRENKTQEILDFLVQGKNMALVTDAGTPGISDPGNKLIERIVSIGIKFVPIPGPSALGAMISVAGIDMQNFFFMGFPPHKKGRETFFKKVAGENIPVVYYESTHRIAKNLDLLMKIDNTKKIIVGKELTKMFEEIIRGNIMEILEYFKRYPEKIKGEFVIIAYND